MSNVLIWIKKDLRITDHEPLMLSMSYDQAMAVYLVEPSLMKQPDWDDCHSQFLDESLTDLQVQFKRSGGHLNIIAGEAVDTLKKIQLDFPFDTIISMQETGNMVSYQRDLAVRDWCNDHQINWIECRQFGVVRRLKDRDGWAKQWSNLMYSERFDQPERLPKKVSPLDIPISEAIPNYEYNPNLQSAGRHAAEQCLNSFTAERGFAYRRSISSPLTAELGGSRLSPYITFGTLSMREVVHALLGRMADLKERGVSGRAQFKACMERLHWHCHFMQKLEDEPEIEQLPMARSAENLRQNSFNQDYYDRWCNGQTGYPFVDACMRYLRHYKWINFRMRAMLVSFASYHLWLDYEPGIHYSQIQMQSGTTLINAVRIYAPIKQGFDQDPDAQFIKTWVPELRELPTDYAHEPWKLPDLLASMHNFELGKDYPHPIVDHKTAYKNAQQKLFDFRKSDVAKAEKPRILEKHASRRTPSTRSRR